MTPALRKMSAVAAVVAIVLASARGQAASVTLSEMSSDQTGAALLDAQLVFTLSGDQLTLTVSNQTGGDNPYQINWVFFNTTDDISSLLMAGSPLGWTLHQSVQAGDFGVFDYALQGSGLDPLLAGEAADFTFTADGAAGQMDDGDFVSDRSTNPPGTMRAIAAARFGNGPGNDDAFGASGVLEGVGQSASSPVPLPSGAIMGLVLLASAGAMRRREMKRRGLI